MAGIMKKCFYLMNLLISISMIIYIYSEHYQRKAERRTLNVRESTSAITALGDKRTFILSPYYDPRGRTPSVRVLVIIHRRVKKLYCWFHCDYNSSVSVRAHINHHRDWFHYAYGTAALLCEEPPDCPYRYISIHWSKGQNITHLPRFEVRNRPPPAAPSVNFTVCISTMYGNYNNVLQTIQSLEMYKLLGAGRVTLYLNQCHQNLEKVLRYYVEEGILEVIPWPIHKFLRISNIWRYHLSNNSQVHYFAQSATLNDCLYRNMYSSKFVFLHDIDEIILPVKHHDWPSLMESLEKRYPEASVFFFENHIFPAVANSSEWTTWGDVPGVDILQNIFKKRVFGKNRKYLVDPRKVYQASIHRVLKKDGKHKYVPRRLAFGFHCKSRQPASNDSLITDRTLWRYNVSLTQNVNKVIQQVFLHR
uniref:Glycosyltransferase family 92 protein n=1 Tax=Leptobrachium leishanense TaxID=445787 RepID=A0A8C5PKX4_9ANUR